MKKKLVKCRDCAFFEPDTGQLDGYKGVCRFNPPLVSAIDNLGDPKFPITFADQYCGLGVHNDFIDWENE